MGTGHHTYLTNLGLHLLGIYLRINFLFTNQGKFQAPEPPEPSSVRPHRPRIEPQAPNRVSNQRAPIYAHGLKFL